VKLTVEAVIVLNWFLDLITLSDNDTDTLVIVLNLLPKDDTLSDNDMDCDIDLNEPYSLDTESDNDVDSDTVLIAAIIRDNESDIDVDSVIVLNIDEIPLTLSDKDVDCETERNDANIRDKLSDNDTLSVNPLIELYILDTLSDNDILGSVIVSLLISLLSTESVIGCVLIATSNVVESPNIALSNNAPKSRIQRFTVGVMVPTVAPMDIDCDMFLIPANTLDTLSERLIDDAVIERSDASILAGVSDNDMLVAVIPLCACNDCVALSVKSITPPLVVSNMALSYIASSNICFVTVMFTKYCNLVSNMSGPSNTSLSNTDVDVTDTD